MVGYLHSIFPGLGIILQIIIFLLFLFVIYWILKSGKNSSSPKEILDKRLANGKISKKEYIELLEEINSSYKHNN